MHIYKTNKSLRKSVNDFFRENAIINADLSEMRPCLSKNDVVEDNYFRCAQLSSSAAAAEARTAEEYNYTILKIVVVCCQFILSNWFNKHCGCFWLNVNVPEFRPASSDHITVGQFLILIIIICIWPTFDTLSHQSTQQQ